MGAVEEFIDQSPAFLKGLDVPTGEIEELRLRIDAACDSRLVGDDDDQVTGRVEAGNGIGGTRNPMAVFWSREVAGVKVYHAISVKEGGGPRRIHVAASLTPARHCTSL